MTPWPARRSAQRCRVRDASAVPNDGHAPPSRPRCTMPDDSARDSGRLPFQPLLDSYGAVEYPTGMGVVMWALAAVTHLVSGRPGGAARTHVTDAQASAAADLVAEDGTYLLITGVACALLAALITRRRSSTVLVVSGCQSRLLVPPSPTRAEIQPRTAARTASTRSLGGFGSLGGAGSPGGAGGTLGTGLPAEFLVRADQTGRVTVASAVSADCSTVWVRTLTCSA